MAIFDVIDPASGGDTRYEGFVKSATNFATLESSLSAATTHVLVGGGSGVAPVFTAATGSGAPVRATSPTLVTPTIGAATATSINKIAITAPASGGTLTIADGVTFTASTTGTAAILGANTFTGGQILSDQLLSRAMLKDCGVTYVDKGSSGTNTQTLDYTAGSHQRIKATGNFTIATSNWPPTGNLGEMLLELVGDGTGRTITWPTIYWVKIDGTLTTTFANNGVTLVTTDNAVNFCLLWSRDAGTTIYGKWVR